ncbi:uncharacterized protein LOC110349379 isoform X3 [Heterocephalus glaber]|uniref:Uncharacterized protein LOC110349379 isoform X3 n=1 Tax=Heterocephalus glaber TaxID=10181 RepID=A0AAX6T433_HETGA|nr:uncharacterized protein LOC110349379 isoform X3 [Heterocephalus glaber]
MGSLRRRRWPSARAHLLRGGAHLALRVWGRTCLCACVGARARVLGPCVQRPCVRSCAVRARVARVCTGVAAAGARPGHGSACPSLCAPARRSAASPPARSVHAWGMKDGRWRPAGNLQGGSGGRLRARREAGEPLPTAGGEVATLSAVPAFIKEKGACESLKVGALLTVWMKCQKDQKASSRSQPQVPGIELRTLCLPHRQGTIELHPQPWLGISNFPASASEQLGLQMSAQIEVA